MSARSFGMVPPQIKIPLNIGVVVVLIGITTSALFFRSRSAVNKVALSERPKGVTTVLALAARYRPTRRYVGTVAPWLEARVGPQFTAAYLDTVLVRPGDSVQKGQVLATLDCKSASAQSKAMQMQARALSTTQEALSKEATRLSGLLEGGYVSPNEVERRTAESASKQSELLAANTALVLQRRHAEQKLAEVQDELREYEDLLAKQHERTTKADTLWRAAHPGKELVLPDLGDLIEGYSEILNRVQNVSES